MSVDQELGHIVHRGPGGWYFYDETWGDRCGPFLSHSDAAAACREYIRTQLEGLPPTDFKWPTEVEWDSTREIAVDHADPTP